MTPLGREIAAIIAREGPISLARYMSMCLGDPIHGYYMTRDPLGRSGDFTTAPEISQIFGELIGIWAITAWQAMGEPAEFALAELGPGRGTLMADVLRVGRFEPRFAAAARAQLVETSPVLRQRQSATLAQVLPKPIWHETIDTLPELPMIVIANEFFDALPIHQYFRIGGAWHQRRIGIGESGELCWDHGVDAVTGPDAAEGAIREVCPAGLQIVGHLARRFRSAAGAMLAIDYGYAGSGVSGDTFQAIAGHRYADPFEAPGQADLTAHVDFPALARAATQAGAGVGPILTQHTLLHRLGLAQRVEKLSTANPDHAQSLSAAHNRLAGRGRGEMGLLFKALSVTSPGLSVYGFDTPDPLIET